MATKRFSEFRKGSDVIKVYAKGLNENKTFTISGDTEGTANSDLEGGLTITVSIKDGVVSLSKIASSAFDSAPASGSSKLVSSGAVHTAIQNAESGKYYQNALRLLASDNLDNVMGAGIGETLYYWAASSVPSNAPESVACNLVVIRGNAGGVIQLVYRASGTTAANYYYKRAYNENNQTWSSSWSTCYFSPTSTYTPDGERGVNGAAIKESIKSSFSSTPSDDYSASEKLVKTNLDSEASTRSAADTALGLRIDGVESDVSAIEAKIPSAASSSNQLADKAFVNSSVQTASSNFRGSWATKAAIPTNVNSYPADYSGSKTPTTNDYLVVQADESKDGGTWRYKYTGVWATDGKNGWIAEYEVNETPLTTAQLAALNSGITSAKVSDYDSKPSADGTGATGTWPINISGMSSHALTGRLTASDNIDNIANLKSNGGYQVYSFIEKPGGTLPSGIDVAGVLEHVGIAGTSLSSGNAVQRLWSRDFDSFFVRYKNGGTWSSWDRVYLTATDSYSATGTRPVNGTAVASAINTRVAKSDAVWTVDESNDAIVVDEDFMSWVFQA